MALWTPSGINNNRVALGFSNMLWDRIVSILKRKYGFWYAIQQKDESFMMKNDLLRFAFTEEITGYKMEVSFRGKQKSTTKIGLGSPEVQLRGTSYDSNIWGGYQFDLCKYTQHVDIPGSEYDQLKGNEAKTETALEAYRDYMAEGLDEDIANDLHGNTTQSQTSIAGLPFVISTTSAYAFDRTDDAHAKFRSQVDDASSSALTRSMLGLNQKKCYDAGAERLFGLAGIQNLQDIQDLVQDRIHSVMPDDRKDWFGGMYTEYGGVPYVMDARCAANTVYHIAPDEWKVVKNERAMNTDGIVYHPGTFDSYVLRAILYLGVACRRPFCQGSIINLG